VNALGEVESKELVDLTQEDDTEVVESGKRKLVAQGLRTYDDV
jgi:hypothetical protein